MQAVAGKDDSLPLIAYYAAARKHDATSFAIRHPDPVILYTAAKEWSPDKSFATTTQLVSVRELRRTQGTEAGQKGVEMRVALVKKSARNPFVDQIYLGRANNNDIILEDESVSKAHAFFTNESLVWKISDVESANGTFVAGVRVAKTASIADGVQLRFGQCQATFFMPRGFFAYLTHILAST